MARECECTAILDEDGECPACRAEIAEAHRLYGGGRHHHLKPVDREWKSRDRLIRESDPD